MNPKEKKILAKINCQQRQGCRLQRLWTLHSFPNETETVSEPQNLRKELTYLELNSFWSMQIFLTVGWSTTNLRICWFSHHSVSKKHCVAFTVVCLSISTWRSKMVMGCRMLLGWLLFFRVFPSPPFFKVWGMLFFSPPPCEILYLLLLMCQFRMKIKYTTWAWNINSTWIPIQFPEEELY